LTDRTGTSTGAGLEQATKISAIPKGSPVTAKDFINLTEFMTGGALKNSTLKLMTTWLLILVNFSSSL
jgi:hypothetical protein